MGRMRIRHNDDDYLRGVHALQSRGLVVSTSGLAAWVGVSAPAASMMLKRLEDSGAVRHASARRFVLTGAGERRALRVVRRHRLLETFLHRALGVPWDELHAEAEVLGPVISERFEERMAAALGHPTHDPHGDPIPPASGEHRETWGVSLALVRPGTEVRVQRVTDRDPEALRFLAGVGIVPGARISVERVDPLGGPVWVAVAGRSEALGRELAGIVTVDEP